MKVYIFIALLIGITGCSQTPECGAQLTTAEETRILHAVEAGGYTYSDEDLDVQADVSDAALTLAGEDLIVETFFFMKNKEEIGIMFVADFPKGLVDKIACHMLTANIKGLPKKRYLLFMDEPTGGVRSTVKTKK